MVKVLFIGQKPETVDFADPSLPPGLDDKKIRAGIAVSMAAMAERGWHADECMVTPDAAGLATIESALSQATYDCVVIGGGIRLPPKSLVLFEGAVNAVVKAAPGTPIAFNTKPEDTADAAARQLAES